MRRKSQTIYHTVRGASIERDVPSDVRTRERTDGRKEGNKTNLETLLFSRFPTTDPRVEKRNDLAAATGISTAAATGIAILSLLKLIILLNPSPAKVTLYKSVGELFLFVQYTTKAFKIVTR